MLTRHVAKLLQVDSCRHKLHSHDAIGACCAEGQGLFCMLCPIGAITKLLILRQAEHTSSELIAIFGKLLQELGSTACAGA